MSGYLAGAVFGAGVAAIGWWAMIPGPPLKTRVLPYTDQGWTPRRAALPAVRFFFRILDALGSSRASVERRTTALGSLREISACAKSGTELWERRSELSWPPSVWCAEFR